MAGNTTLNQCECGSIFWISTLWYDAICSRSQLRIECRCGSLTLFHYSTIWANRLKLQEQSIALHTVFVQVISSSVFKSFSLMRVWINLWLAPLKVSFWSWLWMKNKPLYCKWKLFSLFVLVCALLTAEWYNYLSYRSKGVDWCDTNPLILNETEEIILDSKEVGDHTDQWL